MKHELESSWTHKKLEKLLPSALTDTGFWNKISPNVRYLSEGRFLPSLLNPSKVPTILGGSKYVSLGTVNVTNYDDFAWADHETLERAKKANIKDQAGSIETTHGVIRIIAEDFYKATPAFLFVSGITDRVGYFDMEVNPRVYSQNFVAAHNAGIALSWFLPELINL